MKNIKFLMCIVVGIFLLGVSVSNHIAYKNINSDFDEFLKQYEDFGIEVDYNLDYNILVNYFLRQKVYFNNVSVNFKETEKTIKIKRIGVGDFEYEKLNIQLQVMGLELPISIFYSENHMNPMIESYFSALRQIGIDRNSILETNFNVDLKEENNSLFGFLILDIEKLLEARLDLNVEGFNADNFNRIMNMEIKTQDNLIERQVLINEVYQNIKYNRFNLSLIDRGIADAILMETQEMYNMEELNDARTAIIGEIEDIRKETEINFVMNVLTKELINFFSE